MRFIIIIILFCGLSVNLFSQIRSDTIFLKKASVTIGILNGGGSLIGIDYESLITKRIGVQIGAGLVGFGGGINYHLKPNIRSSFISLQYWHQGFGELFAQDAIGPSFVYRGKKWLTFQIGIGANIQQGPAYPKNLDKQPIMLLYSIGAYFPL
jgi:hypothetical protein